MAALGRRFGKTTMAEELVIGPALAGYSTAWFAPTYKLLAEAWRDIKRVTTPVTRQVSETEHRLELTSRGVIDCWTLDSEDPARGRAYYRVALDEAGMVAGLMSRWENAIRPTLSDFRGEAWFLGTPKGLNAFHTLYQAGQDPAQPEWASWRGPTSDNPYIDPREIEDARRTLPERVFAQEYLAEFLTDGAGVFRGVLAACRATRQDQRVDGHAYVFGVDWGKVNDFTVLSVIDATTREQIHLERFNQIDYFVQKSRLAILAQKFKPQLIVCEANSIGAPNIEDLARMGLPVWSWTATHASKINVIEGLGLAIERSDLAILADRVQTAELLAYEVGRSPSGIVTYSAPEGMHDDTVIALALAWLGACAPDARPRQRGFHVEV